MRHKPLEELSDDELESLARSRNNPYYLTIKQTRAKLAQAGIRHPETNAETSKERVCPA